MSVEFYSVLGDIFVAKYHDILSEKPEYDHIC